VAATNGTLKGEPLQFPDIRTDLGLTLVDTLHLVCRWDYTAKELRNYDLKSVAKHFGVDEPNRPVLTHEQILVSCHNNSETFDAYLTADLTECLRVFLWLIPPYHAISQMTGLPLGDICIKSTAWVWNKILERHYGRDYNPKPDRKRKYVGGLVVARKGLFYPCCKIDIASLYPTIMLAYRIHSRKDEDQYALKWLKTLTIERLKLKTKAKQGNRDADAKQQAMKVLINSLYGFYGTDGYGFNDMEAAERVTTIGRKILIAIISAIEDAGGVVVEADTDGVIVKTNDPNHIIEAIELSIPKPFKVELEWKDATVYVCGKKNYIVLNSDGQIVEVKGSALRGRDKEAIYTKFIPTYLLTYAINGKDAANEFATRVRNEIASGSGWKWVVKTHRVGKNDKFLVNAGFKVGELATYAYKDRKRKLVATDPKQGYDVGSYLKQFDEILREIMEVISGGSDGV